jgi:tetratricopeptide (TPR) repeat protein
VQYSPDGQRLLTASFDGTARTWDAETGEPLVTLNHCGWVIRAMFSRDGSLVATGSRDKTARVWEAETGNPITPPLLHGDIIHHVVFSPDGQRLVTIARSSIIGMPNLQVWDIRREDRTLPELAELAQALAARILAADGSMHQHAVADETWRHLHSRWPGDFQATPQQIWAWHQREALACESAKLWPQACMHWQRLAELEPHNALIQGHLGYALAETGQYKSAVAALMRAAEGDPTGRRFHLLHVAALYIADNDIPAYRQLCGKMFDQVKDSESLPDLNDACWLLSLAPDSHPNLKDLADKVTRILAKEDAPSFALNTAGSYFYRIGRYDAALRALEASMKKYRGSEGSSFDWVFISMIHYKLGRPEEARKWLDRAKDNVARILEGMSKAPIEPLWRIEVEFLLREAEELLGEGSKRE